jgi:hypothetical protein
LIVDEVTERNRALSKAWSAKIMAGRENWLSQIIKV